jgi:hypothetical protein
MNNQWWHMLWENCKQQKGKSMQQYYCLHLARAAQDQNAGMRTRHVMPTHTDMAPNKHPQTNHEHKEELILTNQEKQDIGGLASIAQRMRLDVFLCCICSAIQ